MDLTSLQFPNRGIEERGKPNFSLQFKDANNIINTVNKYIKVQCLKSSKINIQR